MTGAARGMTLLEVLVVLVLVSLITTALIQGVGYFLGQYQFMQRFQQEADHVAKVRLWFVSSVDGLIAYRGERAFAGDEKQFSGASISTLGKLSGQVGFLSWQLTENETGSLTLIYTNDVANGWPIQKVQVAAEFEYQDAGLSWHKKWPPENGADKDILPSAIRLRNVLAGEDWIAVPDLSLRPLVDFRE